MIFIAGIGPKDVRLDEVPRRCPLCNQSQAYFKRTDLYLNLFFVPLLRIQKGEPVLMCEACEEAIREFADEMGHKGKSRPDRCSRCGGELKPGFRFCPHCGQPADD